jgi:cysteine desulfurase / selenocysteine lyase
MPDTTERGEPPPPGARSFDVARVRRDFPALEQKVNGRPLVYLDSAATAQTPSVVLEAMQRCYLEFHANVNRGAHTLSGKATRAYEDARRTVAHFINAAEPDEVVFTSGCTAAINLVAYALGESLGAGDEVVVSALEHHSNLLPWQELCRRRGSTLRVIPIDARGELSLDAYAALLGPRTRLVAVAEVSNALGSVIPIAHITRLAHAAGALVLVDGAQAVARRLVDVQAVDADFYAFSGHKLYGPFGTGVLYGKRALLEALPPFMTGGGMVEEVSLERATYAALPRRFEAGTPNLAGVVGLGAAVKYLGGFDRAALERHDRALVRHCEALLEAIDGVRLIGSARDKLGLCSFVVAGIHPHDVSTVLDHEGVAVRAGHHCAEPVMAHFGVNATLRASFGIYTTEAELEQLAAGVLQAKKLFRR